MASFKFTLNERRAGLFEATQTTDDPLDYLKELTQLIRSADWANLTPETAICHFFKKGVKCKDSQEICVKFLEEGGGDLNQLRDELKKLKKKETSANRVCKKCQMWGHDEINCWGQCQHCLDWGYDQKL